MRNSANGFKFPERSLRDFYSILFRHKWKVTIFFLAVMTTVTVGTFLTTEIYKAEAKLLLRIGRENVSSILRPPPVRSFPSASPGKVRSTPSWRS